jgi:hypothetical protein
VAAAGLATVASAMAGAAVAPRPFAGDQCVRRRVIDDGVEARGQRADRAGLAGALMPKDAPAKT